MSEKTDSFTTLRLVRDSSLRGSYKAVLWALASRCDGATGRNARPSRPTLAADAGVSEGTVSKALAALKDAGVIIQSGDYRNRTGSPTPIWMVSHEALRRLARPEKPSGTDDFDTDTEMEKPSGFDDFTPTLAVEPVRLRTEPVRLRTQTRRDLTTTSPEDSKNEDSHTYAADQRSTKRDSSDEVVYKELIDGLVEAISCEYVSLPYSYADTYEQQAVAILDDVLDALAEVVDRPLPYLRAILQNDGEFKFGLAVREKWHDHYGSVA
jgi:hypothetical protein